MSKIPSPPLQVQSSARCLVGRIFFPFQRKSSNFLYDIFWNGIYLTYIPQFGHENFVYDYLFTSQRVSLCLIYRFFYYTLTLFVPIGVIKDRVAEINSKFFNGKLWPFRLCCLISSVFICSSP